MIQCERVELLNIAWVRVESCGAGGGQKVLNKRIWEGNIGATKDPLSVTFTWKESAAAGYKSNFKLQNHLFEEENNWPCFLRLATLEFQTTKQFQTLHQAHLNQAYGICTQCFPCSHVGWYTLLKVHALIFYQYTDTNSVPSIQIAFGQCPSLDSTPLAKRELGALQLWYQILRVIEPGQLK